MSEMDYQKPLCRLPKFNFSMPLYDTSTCITIAQELQVQTRHMMLETLLNRPGEVSEDALTRENA
jgi:hypothetical protein